MVKMIVKPLKSLEKEMKRLAKHTEDAGPKAMAKAAPAVKAWTRGHVGGKLGRRLGNSIKSRAYPNAKHDAAAIVYTKAPEIIRAHDEGATIRARGGKYLAIPTAATPRRGRSKPTPASVEKALGQSLVFIQRPGRAAVLIAPQVKTTKAGRIRGLTDRQRQRAGVGKTVTGAASAVMFILVREVKLKKRTALREGWAKIADKAVGEGLTEALEKR